MIGLARFKLMLRRVVTVVEFCRDCGRHQPLVWTASDDLWREVTGRMDGGGIYCPECFDRRATIKGFMLRWVPIEDKSPFQQDTGAEEARRQSRPDDVT